MVIINSLKGKEEQRYIKLCNPFNLLFSYSKKLTGKF